MFHRIREFGLIDVDGRVFRPRLYGEPQADGSWTGWIVFFPLRGGGAIAPPSPETTQRSFAVLEAWAAGVTVVYLYGALERALLVAEQSPAVQHLVDAEYQALDDAARLESAAHLERTAADLDKAAAKVARAEAEQIRQERLEAEAAVAALDEHAARVEANLHEAAAREARAAASEAKDRRRSARAQTRSQAQPTPRSGKRK
jgi:hypothetical protein